MTSWRINNHIIRDDVTNDTRRRERVPSNVLSLNRGNSSGRQYCPECQRRSGMTVAFVYHKELSSFVCPTCGSMRSVNPLNRSEMAPNSTVQQSAIPSLDGMTDSQAYQHDTGAGRRSKPIMRSIGNAHERSQYSSENRGFDNYNDAALRADKETRQWADANNATIVYYEEYIPRDNQTASSEELRKRARLEV
jgi:hypothetical protein